MIGGTGEEQIALIDCCNKLNFRAFAQKKNSVVFSWFSLFALEYRAQLPHLRDKSLSLFVQ